MKKIDSNENFKKFIEGAKSFLSGLSAYSKVQKNQQQQKEKEKEKPDIIKEFESIDQNSQINEMFKRAEYDPPTDEELKTAAENELALKHSQQIDKVTDNIAKAYQKLESKKEDEVQKTEQKDKKNDDVYQSQIKNAEKNAIKKGFARSSIIEEQKKELNSARVNNKQDIYNTLNAKLNEIESELFSLEEQKQKALDTFQLEHAANIEKKINDLKKERDKKIEDTIKYNNQMTEKEKKYFSSAEGAAQMVDIYEQKLAAAKKYYDTLSKQDALNDFIANEDMKKHLGAYYAYMLNYLNNRAG